MSKARPEFERAGGPRSTARASASREPGGHSAAAGRSAARSPAHLDQAIRLYGRRPDAAQAHFTCGPKSIVRIGTRRRQLPNCSCAVELAPDFAEAWSDLGRGARKNLSDGKGALTAFRRVGRVDPAKPSCAGPSGSPVCWTPGRSTKAGNISMSARSPRSENQSALNAPTTRLAAGWTVGTGGGR